MEKRILIMMPNKPGFFKRRRLKKTLKKGGYEIAGEAYGLNVTESAAFFQRTKCDVALVELLPENVEFSDNTRLLSGLRDADSSVPIVVCGQPILWRDYLVLGAAGFVELPTEKEVLLAQLDRVLSVPRIEKYNGNGKRVLVQQDDELSLAWINLLLRENGYIVEDLVYHSYDLNERREFRRDVDRQLAEVFEEDGKSLPEKEGPSLLIADELDTLQKFRESDPGVSATVCSDHPTESFITQCIRCGAKDFMRKPFDPEEFLKRVHLLCRLSKPQPKPEAPAPAEPEQPEPETPAPAEPKQPKPETPAPAEPKQPKPEVRISPEVTSLIQEIEKLTNTKILDTAGPEAGVPEEKTANTKTPGTAGRVLLAQEFHHTLVTMRDILEVYNYEIVGGATEGWRCLEFYRKKKPDLVILDAVLAEGQDGVKILELLRKEDPPAVVLMTGAPEESVILACRRNGAADFLEQPFKPRELLNKVQDLLRSHRS